MKAICRICNEEFEARRKGAAFCPKDHYRPCDECGEDYLIKKVNNRPRFCSGSCSAVNRNKGKKSIFSCQICGDSFESTNPNARYCGKLHTKKCKQCGEQFDIPNTSKVKDYCSRQCTIDSHAKEKACKQCGESFIPRFPTAVYCDREHYTDCKYCGKTYVLVDPKRLTSYCSTSCGSKDQKHERICEVCGDKFTAGHAMARFCGKDHTLTCRGCGVEFVVNPYRRPTQTCGDKRCAASIIDWSKRNAKTAKTLTERYGQEVTNAYQLDEVKQKRIESSRIKYGFDNPSSHPDVQEKRRKTNLARYGVENGGGAAEVQKKIKQSNLEKYGVENVFQAKEVKEKIRETLREKYGENIVNPSQIPDVREKMRRTTRERFGVDSVLSLPEVQLQSNAVQRARMSRLNKEWKERIESELSLPVELEVSIGDGLYCDLRVEDLLIEINPVITHSSTKSFVHITKRCTDENCLNPRHAPIPQNQHQMRALVAESKGFVMLQKFDWHRDDIFMSIIRSKLKRDENRVYARNCEIRFIDQPQANRFLKENHLLGAAKDQKFCVGLFYNDELVHVHTYGPARINKNFQWEAIRSCSKMNWQIVGGFSRCDSFFFKSVDPDSVISYVDLAISTGATELANPGWTLKSTNKPSGIWVKTGRLPEGRPRFVRASSARLLSADKLLGFEVGDKYPALHDDGRTFTNDDVLIAEGYLQVFDAGSRTFTWNNKLL